MSRSGVHSERAAQALARMCAACHLAGLWVHCSICQGAHSTCSMLYRGRDGSERWDSQRRDQRRLFTSGRRSARSRAHPVLSRIEPGRVAACCWPWLPCRCTANDIASVLNPCNHLWTARTCSPPLAGQGRLLVSVVCQCNACIAMHPLELHMIVATRGELDTGCDSFQYFQFCLLSPLARHQCVAPPPQACVPQCAAFVPVMSQIRGQVDSLRPCSR